RGHAVEVGSLKAPGSKAADVAVTLVVGENDDEVRQAVRSRVGGRGAGGGQEKQTEAPNDRAKALGCGGFHVDGLLGPSLFFAGWLTRPSLEVYPTDAGRSISPDKRWLTYGLSGKSSMRSASLTRRWRDPSPDLN